MWTQTKTSEIVEASDFNTSLLWRAHARASVHEEIETIENSPVFFIFPLGFVLGCAVVRGRNQ